MERGKEIFFPYHSKYYVASLIFGGLALSSTYFKNINYALLLTAIAVASYIGIRKLGYREIQVLSNGILLPLFDTPMINQMILRVFWIWQ